MASQVEEGIGENFKGGQITFTGYAMGGAVAQVAARHTKRAAVVFGAPGTRDLPKLAVRDSDGDGIPDHLDGKDDSKDSDGDGIPDHLEDSDGDGIPDGKEDCDG